MKKQTSIFIPGKTRINYGAALFGLRERKAIQKVLDRNWWALNGEGELFEKELAKYIGKKYCILTNSGSSALLIALASLKLPKGTEVVIPAVTFPTAFNAIIQNQLKPFVIDSQLSSFNLKLDEVEMALKKGAKAIIAVHMAGNPVDMVAVMALARKYKVYVIEDNCDGLGGDINGKKLGSFADVSCTSMYAGHIINMGEGGAVFTDNAQIAARVRSFRDWGRREETDQRAVYSSLPKDYPSRYVYSEIGYNLRPLELQAAMGRVQLRRIEQIKKKRQENFDKLRKIFVGRPGIKLIETIKGAHPSWFSFPLLYDHRAELITHLEKHNIETRPVFAGNILRQPAYKHVKVNRISKLANADKVLHQGFFIGVHPLIPPQAFPYINSVVDSFFKSKK